MFPILAISIFVIVASMLLLYQQITGFMEPEEVCSVFEYWEE